MRRRAKTGTPSQASPVTDKHLKLRRSLADSVHPVDASPSSSLVDSASPSSKHSDITSSGLPSTSTSGHEFSKIAVLPPSQPQMSEGQPLDADTRAYMEPRFGHDFSQVRIHADGVAETTARDVNATAYTIGQDVVFDSGQYRPETDTGKRLLAHELAHVVQQSRGGTSTPPPLPTHPLEQAAQRAASAIVQGGTASVAGASAPGIARQPRSLNETLDPTSMSDAELAQEIALIRQWLADNQDSSSDRDQLTTALSALEAEVTKRSGQQNQTPANQQPDQSPADSEQNYTPANQQPNESSSDDTGSQGETGWHPPMALPDEQQNQTSSHIATLSSSGSSLSSGEEPASFEFGGLPAFMFDSPGFEEPIAEAGPIETGEASYELKLFLAGKVKVTFQNSLEGATADVSEGTYEFEATHSVNSLFEEGINVEGISGHDISFGTTVGTEFDELGIQLYPFEDAIGFTGTAKIHRSLETQIGPVTIEGEPSFELKVTRHTAVTLGESIQIGVIALMVVVATGGAAWEFAGAAGAGATSTVGAGATGGLVKALAQ